MSILPTTYDSFHPNRVKHLDMIQAVIARLANNSFLIKGWAITVAGAFFGFAINSKSWRLAVASVVPIVTFWGLDTYFLRSERLFRALGDAVRTSEGVEPFYMGATSREFIDALPLSSNVASWWRTFRRPTLAVLYGSLLLSAIVVAVLILTGAHVGR